MRALPRPLRPLLLFAPSVVLGLLGGVWLWFRPLRLEAQVGPLGVLLAAAALLVGLLGAGWLLERTLPSFRHAGRLLERALQNLPVTLPLALGLALATALAEELFFRGALLGLIGVWPQALLFGLLHPATRRGWSYTLFTLVAGLAFGYATLWTGSLWAAILAHFVINLQGFLEIRARQLRQRARWAAYAQGVERTAERAISGSLSAQGATGASVSGAVDAVSAAVPARANGAADPFDVHPTEPPRSVSPSFATVSAASDGDRSDGGATVGASDPMVATDEPDPLHDLDGSPAATTSDDDPAPSIASDGATTERTRVGTEAPAADAQPEGPESPSDDANPESPGSSAPPPREPPAP